ncbi:hypothetical protein ACLOJK_023944, partial [Asimina triloba]
QERAATIPPAADAPKQPSTHPTEQTRKKKPTTNMWMIAGSKFQTRGTPHQWLDPAMPASALHQQITGNNAPDRKSRDQLIDSPVVIKANGSHGAHQQLAHSDRKVRPPHRTRLFLLMN